MVNCLVTKLKGVVNNDNLPIYDTLKIEVLEGNGPRKLVLNLLNGTTVKTTGAGTFTVDGGSSVNSYVESNQSSSHTFLFGSGTYNILIYKDKTISNILESNIGNVYDDFSTDISSLSFSNTIRNIYMRYKKIKGDFVLKNIDRASLATEDKDSLSISSDENTEYTRMVSISSNCKKGDININHFNNCTSMTLININNHTGVHGEIEQLAEAQYNAGRTSGKIRLAVLKGSVTDDGNSVNMNYIISKGGTEGFIDVTFSAEGYTKSYI